MPHSLHNTVFYMLLLAGFSLPISTAGVNTLLLMITLLMSILLLSKRITLVLNPISLAALALLLWILLSISYSLASFNQAIQYLKHYIEFLYLPILLLLFRQARWQRLGIHCFMIGILVVLLGSYCVWLTGIPLGKATLENPVIFKNYITQGILFCVALALLLWYWQHYPRWRVFSAVLLFLLLFNVLFIGQGRSAYVIVLALLLWAGFRWQGWHGALLALLGMSLLLFSAYQVSDSTRERLQQTWHNVQTYKTATPADNSVGYRLEFYYYSVQLIAQRPLFGTGTGGFAQAYATLTADKQVLATDNPHNEYLMISVQWGLLGLLLFGLFIGLLMRFSKDLGEFSLPAQALLIVMLVGCLFNSLWLDFTEGHTFAYFIGLFYARLGEQRYTLHGQFLGFRSAKP